ncbi:uncharacterized protein EDB93DRAFT_1180802 [Suillus bovinus]|uniref:uncharacterized protein n=1 Tax=Suillus bovinus TaxID=48563 RepID=UPI001B862BC5|nr:uncharacterized protein EDB93DRAFT_1180802 [Suillus bovinus]KAG2130179.1 hypothetical protein EDB93DRAFT_1180802 [Suillus bovinus]
MGAPPAAAPPYYPVAPPLAQPSYNQPLEQPQQQAPVAAPEESAVRRGKRKAEDLDDSDAPPRKKQLITFDNYDFELVQKNGEVCYRCCMPQCENVPAVPRAGIQDHMRSMKHPWLQSSEDDEAESDWDFANIEDFCSMNQEDTDKSSQGSCEGSSNAQLGPFVNNIKDSGALTRSEMLNESNDSLGETTDLSWVEEFNEFVLNFEAAEFAKNFDKIVGETVDYAICLNPV